MKIYIDLLVLQDTFIMSFMLFFTARLLNLKCKMSRIITTSLISSVISIIILFSFPHLYDNWIIKLLSTFILLKIGLKLKIDNEFIQKLILFWIITSLIGGIIVFTEGKLIFILIALAVTFFYILNLKHRKKQKLLLDSVTCFVNFNYKGKKYEFKALIDTGHNVKTIYDEDIIFVKKDLFFEEGGEIKERRVVRYQTVSGENKSEGIKLYDINIVYGGKRICNNAVIVSTPNILNQFDAIVGLSLIEGG